MEFDKIIITNLPAFYKVNLFNEISKTQNIFVVFTGNTSELRNKDFFKKEMIKFKYRDLKELSTLSKCTFIIKLLLKRNYKELILGGWDEPVLWISALLSPKMKNSIIVESSIYESQTSGVKGFIKKNILKRINRVYASGKAQIELIKSLDYSGEIKRTKGVGLFNVKPQPIYESRDNVINFLYVGRLSPEKNLLQLIEIFNRFQDLHLHIVGFGPQENELISKASKNIHFHGAVNNEEVYKYYRDYDVFILPSTSEVWGLVVEESLNNGMPVITSNKVGCVGEVLIDNYNGLVFNLDDDNSLSDKIMEISDNVKYNIIRKNISEMNFEKIAEDQVNVYL